MSIPQINPSFKGWRARRDRARARQAARTSPEAIEANRQRNEQIEAGNRAGIIATARDKVVRFREAVDIAARAVAGHELQAIAKGQVTDEHIAAGVRLDATRKLLAAAIDEEAALIAKLSPKPAEPEAAKP